MTGVDIVLSTLLFVRQFSIQIIIALVALNLLRNKFRPGLVNVPGPAVAAYTKLWKTYNAWKGHPHLDAIRLHKKYGNLVRIGPNHVSVADPKWIPVFYSTKEEYLKTAFYPLQSISWKRKQAVNLFSTREPDHHRIQRRKIGHVYSLPDLLQCESSIDSCTKLFIQRLDNLVSQGRSIDLNAWLQYYAYNVVAEIAFGRNLDFLEAGSDVDDIMSITTVILTYASVIGQIPLTHHFLLGNPILARLMAPMETWSPVLLFTLKAINDRKASLAEQYNNKGSNPVSTSISTAERRDMLSRWVSVEDSSPHKMDTRELVVNLATNIFAGSDTTSIALRAVIYYLCKNPQCMRRLVDDIDAADQAGKLSAPVLYKKASELPYLAAVLKESMRMHPSVGLLLERHVPPEGVEIDGHFLKGGTVVGINPWVTSRNAEVFPNPDTFRPERWLDASEQHLKAMEGLWEFNFGAGARKCIGRNVSWIEMIKIVPELLRRYKIELTHSEKEWKVLNYWFTSQEGVICNLMRRK